MAAPEQQYYRFYGDENVEWCSSSGAGSGYSSAVIPAFQFHDSYSSSMGFPQPAGQSALDSRGRYTGFSCDMNTANSSNGAWAAPPRTTGFCSQDSGSPNSDPDFCRRRMRPETPPSSRGDGTLCQHTGNDLRDFVAGDALIGFWSLEPTARGIQSYPPRSSCH
jgi:hypothetical protein